MEQNTVRRCRSCGNAKVILVNRWEGRWLGVLRQRHPARTEHRCQACGASFSLTPWLFFRFVVGAFVGGQLLFAGVIGLVGAPIAFAVQGTPEALLLLAIGTLTIAFGGATVAAWAGPQVQSWRNPVVPDAAAPELRLGPTEQWRRCLCGEACACAQESERTILGLPLGRTRRYECSRCGDRFSIDDVTSTGFYSLTAIAFIAADLFLASLLPLSQLNGSHVLVLSVLASGAGMAALIAVLGTLIRRRHPRVHGV